MSEIDEVVEYTYAIELGEKKYEFRWTMGSAKRLAAKYGSLHVAFEKFGDAEKMAAMETEALTCLQDFVEAGLVSESREKDAEDVIEGMGFADIQPLVEMISLAIKQSSQQAKVVKKNPTR